uniref:Uncharacterized protein n=1 Tax=Romanomermis culicivorax TaxID=13658 RepID=A0A915IUW3_ROMCU
MQSMETFRYGFPTSAPPFFGAASKLRRLRLGASYFSAGHIGTENYMEFFGEEQTLLF